MMSPSNLEKSNFGNFTLTSWIWVVLWVLPWLEISNKLNDGGGGFFFSNFCQFLLITQNLSLLTLKCPLALFPTLPVAKYQVFFDQSP